MKSGFFLRVVLLLYLGNFTVSQSFQGVRSLLSIILNDQNYYVKSLVFSSSSTRGFIKKKI